MTYRGNAHVTSSSQKFFAGNFRTKLYPRKHMFLVREPFFVEISFTNQDKLKYY